MSARQSIRHADLDVERRAQPWTWHPGPEHPGPRRTRTPDPGPEALTSSHGEKSSPTSCAFSEHWSPKVVGELNGQHVKLVKFQGEFVWHHHEDEDELFLVVKGRFRMEFRGSPGRGSRTGEFLDRPARRRAPPGRGARKCQVLLFEPAATLNTGNVVEGRTRGRLKQI